MVFMLLSALFSPLLTLFWSLAILGLVILTGGKLDGFIGFVIEMFHLNCYDFTCEPTTLTYFATPALFFILGALLGFLITQIHTPLDPNTEKASLSEMFSVLLRLIAITLFFVYTVLLIFTVFVHSAFMGLHGYLMEYLIPFSTSILRSTHIIALSSQYEAWWLLKTLAGLMILAILMFLYEYIRKPKLTNRWMTPVFCSFICLMVFRLLFTVYFLITIFSTL
jgi:hypothetical protein